MLVDAWLVIIGLMLVGGVILRIWQRHLPPVQLHKVSPQAAVQLVGEFLESSYDGQFGYPTGLFRIEKTTDTQIVAQEIVGRGSHFTQILKGLFRAVLTIGSGCGCLGIYLGLCLSVLLAPVLLYAAATEMLLKYLLRSRIITDLERAKDGTKVSFTLRGPVALLVGRRLERAFHAPVLPARVASLAGIPVAAGPGAIRAGGAGTGRGAEAGARSQGGADAADGATPDPSAAA